MPAAELAATRAAELDGASTHVGLVSTSLPLASPSVEPGVYQLVLEGEPEAWTLRWLDASTGAQVATHPVEVGSLGRDDGAHGLGREGDRVTLEARVGTRIRRRVLALRLGLEAVPGALAGPWE